MIEEITGWIVVATIVIYHAAHFVAGYRRGRRNQAPPIENYQRLSKM